MLPLILAAVALAGPIQTFAQVKLVSRTLSNSLQVALAPSVPSEKVAIHVTFDAGSRYEEKVPAGTAWLSNRILLRRLVGFAGGVNQERAYVSTEVSHEGMSDRLQQLAAALGNLVVSDDEFRKARAALIMEAAKQEGPYARSEGVLLSMVYRDGRSHEPETAPIGVTKKDVNMFIRERYGPAVTVVVLAGTFDQEEAMKTLVRTLQSLSPGVPRKSCGKVERTRRHELRRHLRDQDAIGAEVWLAYTAPDSTSRDWLAMNVLADVIGQGKSSRLQRELVAGALAANFGEGMTESPCGSSLFKMRVRLASRRFLSRTEKVITGEVAKLRRQLVSDEELSRAKGQELDWAQSQLSSAPGVASAVARATLFYGRPERVNTEAAAMSAVTAEDLRRVARKYLQRSNRAMVVTTGIEQNR
jgi:zinc protease